MHLTSILATFSNIYDRTKDVSYFIIRRPELANLFVMFYVKKNYRLLEVIYPYGI